MADIEKRYELREIRPDEAQAAAEIEQVCFPIEQACTREEMVERAEKVPELFLVAVERETGTVAGYINGIATDEVHLLDAFYADAGLNDPDGDTVMILGVCVLPEHQGQGLAREMMETYVARERQRGRRRLVLTCLKRLIGMYEGFGFTFVGESDSTCGGETWYEMEMLLNEAV